MPNDSQPVDITGAPLFSGWRLPAFVELCMDALLPFGGIGVLPMREMAKRWGTSPTGVHLWLGEMQSNGLLTGVTGRGKGRKWNRCRIEPIQFSGEEEGWDDRVWPSVSSRVILAAFGQLNECGRGSDSVEIRIPDEHLGPAICDPVTKRNGILVPYVHLLRMAAHRDFFAGTNLVQRGTLLTSERFVCSLFGWDADGFAKFVQAGSRFGVFETWPARDLPKGGITFYFNGYGHRSSGDITEWERTNAWGAVGYNWGLHPSPRKRARSIPSSVRKRVFERANGKCEWCGADDKLEVDHIHPVARGGSAAESNLQLLCSRCNARKSDKVTTSPFSLVEGP